MKDCQMEFCQIIKCCQSHFRLYSTVFFCLVYPTAQIDQCSFAETTCHVINVVICWLNTIYELIVCLVTILFSIQLLIVLFSSVQFKFAMLLLLLEWQSDISTIYPLLLDIYFDFSAHFCTSFHSLSMNRNVSSLDPAQGSLLLLSLTHFLSSFYYLIKA